MKTIFPAYWCKQCGNGYNSGGRCAECGGRIQINKINPKPLPIKSIRKPREVKINEGVLKDAILMLRCINGNIKAGWGVKANSPCHKKLRTILQQLGHNPNHP